MKIVISPSKTMRSNTVTPLHKPQFDGYTNELITFLQAMSKSELKHYLSVSDKLNEVNYQRYQEYEPSSTALFSYTGAQFKAIDALNLSETAHQFLDDNLYIISGLYGLVKPLSQVALYRLPMALNYNKTSLSQYWKPKLYDVLKDETIINLASKEYSVALDERLDVITIEFVNAPSMLVKKLRGQMVNYLANGLNNSLDYIKQFESESYHYNNQASNETTLVFSK